jgi:membrane associated rhomboid family serine protease
MRIPRGRMTDWLAAVTSAVFLLLWVSGRIDYAAAVGGFIPARLTDPSLDVIDGITDLLPVWVTPLSATLIHAGWLHITFNMVMLFFCGRHVEHVTGPWLLLCLYVIGAYAAAGAEWLLSMGGMNPMVGASGAISALLGTYALLYSQQKVRKLGPISANAVRVLWLAAGWTAIQLMIGLATGGAGDNGIGQIAVGAHIGGFIAGLLVTRPLLHLRFRKGLKGLAER